VATSRPITARPRAPRRCGAGWRRARRRTDPVHLGPACRVSRLTAISAVNGAAWLLVSRGAWVLDVLKEGFVLEPTAVGPLAGGEGARLLPPGAVRGARQASRPTRRRPACPDGGGPAAQRGDPGVGEGARHRGQ
jgi:hypothetical protein